MACACQKCPDHESQRKTNATFQTEDWKTWHTNACFGTGYFWYKGCYCNNWISVSSSVNHEIKLDLLLQIPIRDLGFCTDKQKTRSNSLSIYKKLLTGILTIKKDCHRHPEVITKIKLYGKKSKRKKYYTINTVSTHGILSSYMSWHGQISMARFCRERKT